MNGLVTLTDIARRIGAYPSLVHRHIYFFESAPPPTHRMGRGRRLYYLASEADDVVARLTELGLGDRADRGATTA